MRRLSDIALRQDSLALFDRCILLPISQLPQAVELFEPAACSSQAPLGENGAVASSPLLSRAAAAPDNNKASFGGPAATNVPPPQQRRLYTIAQLYAETHRLLQRSGEWKRAAALLAHLDQLRSPSSSSSTSTISQTTPSPPTDPRDPPAALVPPLTSGAISTSPPSPNSGLHTTTATKPSVHPQKHLHQSLSSSSRSIKQQQQDEEKPKTPTVATRNKKKSESDGSSTTPPPPPPPPQQQEQRYEQRFDRIVQSAYQLRPASSSPTPPLPSNNNNNNNIAHEQQRIVAQLLQLVNSDSGRHSYRSRSTHGGASSTGGGAVGDPMLTILQCLKVWRLRGIGNVLLERQVVYASARGELPQIAPPMIKSSQPQRTQSSRHDSGKPVVLRSGSSWAEHIARVPLVYQSVLSSPPCAATWTRYVGPQAATALLRQVLHHTLLPTQATSPPPLSTTASPAMPSASPLLPLAMAAPLAHAVSSSLSRADRRQLLQCVLVRYREEHHQQQHSERYSANDLRSRKSDAPAAGGGSDAEGRRRRQSLWYLQGALEGLLRRCDDHDCQVLGLPYFIEVLDLQESLMISTRTMMEGNDDGQQQHQPAPTTISPSLFECLLRSVPRERIRPPISSSSSSSSSLSSSALAGSEFLRRLSSPHAALFRELLHATTTPTTTSTTRSSSDTTSQQHHRSISLNRSSAGMMNSTEEGGGSIAMAMWRFALQYVEGHHSTISRPSSLELDGSPPSVFSSHNVSEAETRTKGVLLMSNEVGPQPPSHSSSSSSSWHPSLNDENRHPSGRSRSLFRPTHHHLAAIVSRLLYPTSFPWRSQWETAVDLAQRWHRQFAVVPQSSTCRDLLRHWALGSASWEGAFGVLSLQNNGSLPDARVCRELLEWTLVAGNWELTLRLLPRLEGLQDDGSTSSVAAPFDRWIPINSNNNMEGVASRTTGRNVTKAQAVLEAYRVRQQQSVTNATAAGAAAVEGSSSTRTIPFPPAAHRLRFMPCVIAAIALAQCGRWAETIRVVTEVLPSCIGNSKNNHRHDGSLLPAARSSTSSSFSQYDHQPPSQWNALLVLLIGTAMLRRALCFSSAASSASISRRHRPPPPTPPQGDDPLETQGTDNDAQRTTMMMEAFGALVTTWTSSLGSPQAQVGRDHSSDPHAALLGPLLDAFQFLNLLYRSSATPRSDRNAEALRFLFAFASSPSSSSSHSAQRTTIPQLLDCVAAIGVLVSASCNAKDMEELTDAPLRALHRLRQSSSARNRIGEEMRCAPLLFSESQTWVSTVSGTLTALQDGSRPTAVSLLTLDVAEQIGLALYHHCYDSDAPMKKDATTSSSSSSSAEAKGWSTMTTTAAVTAAESSIAQWMSSKGLGRLYLEASVLGTSSK